MDDLLDESDVKIRDAKGLFLRIPKDSIYSENQVRKNFDPISIKEMGLSLEINGQEQPIIVSPLDSKGYCIQKGERRWRGALSNPNVTHLDCIVREPGDIFGQLTENIQREDLTPIELGEAFKEAKKIYGLNNRELSARLGKPESYISKYLGVVKSPDFILDAYMNGIVGDVESINELRKAAELNIDKTQELLKLGKVVTREEAIRFKKELNSPKDVKGNNTENSQRNKTKSTSKQEVTSILVQVSGRQGLVFASGKFADKLTILFDDGELEQIDIDEIKLVGYRL
ncbi:TPA: ParB/RepB/Spo0J family partition protein [Vibrio parahaemolyticus]|nr:ParB/RepB/Spo0J family partition protein [Vibrio parahaemolyticus]